MRGQCAVGAYLLAKAVSNAWRPFCNSPNSFAAPLWLGFSLKMASKSSSAAVKSHVDLSNLPLHGQLHMLVSQRRKFEHKQAITPLCQALSIHNATVSSMLKIERLLAYGESAVESQADTLGKSQIGRTQDTAL